MTPNYKVLKEKLLSALSGTDVQIYGEKYDKALGILAPFNNGEETFIEDAFIIDLLKAKYITERGPEVDDKYLPNYPEHVYRANNGMARNLGFMEQDPNHVENIKKFINELEHFAATYANIVNNQRVSIRNMAEVNKIKSVYEPILAAHTMQDDPKDYKKGNYIADQYERLWILLKLNKAFDKDEFRKITHKLNLALRKGTYNSNEEVKKLFDTELQNTLKKVEKTSTLDYETFKNNTYSNTQLPLFRYLLARVEKYLRDTKNKGQPGRQSDGTQSIYQLCIETPHQVEQTIYVNDANIQTFGSKEEVEKCQNMLGSLLLLGDKEHISTDATYESKLQAYYQSNLIWGQTLCREFYEESNETLGHVRSQLPSHIFEQFKPYDKFDKQALEERTKLLYELVKIIWEVE